jgi:hypothetical protein
VSVSIDDVEANDWVEKVFMPDIMGKPGTHYKKPGYDLSDPGRASHPLRSSTNTMNPTYDFKGQVALLTGAGWPPSICRSGSLRTPLGAWSKRNGGCCG